MDDLIRRSDAIEAIEVVDWYHQNRNKDMVSGANSDEHQAWYKADDVYKALEAVPSADRPQGDAVSRRYLLAEIDDLADEFSEVDENGLHGERWCGISDAKCVIVNAPSVADRPQGEWVPFEYGDERWHKCTACGVADRYIEYVERPNGTTGKLVAIRNYCPNCGAKMKGADEDD